MRISSVILLLIFAAMSVGCGHSPIPRGSQESAFAALSDEEAAVIATLVERYSWGPERALPVLASYISAQAPDEIKDLRLDYRGTLSSDYIATLAANPPEWLIDPKPELDGKLIREALENLRRANEVPADARQVGGVATVPVTELNKTIIALEAASEENPERFWKRFDRKFPGTNGYSSASRVGFSSDHTIAVVYFSWRGGPMLGFGSVHVLQRSRGKWLVVADWDQYGWNS